MLIGSAAALVLLAQAAGAAAQAPPPSDGAAPAKSDDRSCPPPKVIVICGPPPQGYRLNPDVMEAKREAHSAGRPVRQATETPPPECRTVGPFPCMQAGVNLIAAAATAAEMARRVASGEEIGSMFLTDPQPDEYHLYLMAKARREAEEAAKVAAAKAKAAAAKNKAAGAQAASEPAQH